VPFYKQINRRLCHVYPRYSDAAPIGDPTSCLFTARTPSSSDYDLYFEHPAIPNTLHPYGLILVLHDREALTFPFPMFLTFLSGLRRLYDIISESFGVQDCWKTRRDVGKALVRSHQVAFRRGDAEIDSDCKVRTVESKKSVRTMNYNVSLPTHRARAVYHEQSLSVKALAYLSESLSRSFVSTAMSDRYGLMYPAFQRSRVRKRSANRMAGSVGSSAHGK
jgi:hypothetical protein